MTNEEQKQFNEQMTNDEQTEMDRIKYAFRSSWLSPQQLSDVLYDLLEEQARRDFQDHLVASDQYATATDENEKKRLLKKMDQLGRLSVQADNAAVELKKDDLMKFGNA